MLHILLELDNRDISDIVAFFLEAKFDIKSHIPKSSKEAVDLLEHSRDRFDLVICYYDQRKDSVLSTVGSLEKPMPCIICADGKVEPSFVKLKKLVGLARKTHLLDDLYNHIVHFQTTLRKNKELKTILKQLKKDQPESLEDADFCRIRTNLLLKVSPLRADIYIRLSKIKFLKLFRQGDAFLMDDFERYALKKKIEYFYIKLTDTEEFLGRLNEELKTLLSKKTIDRKQVHQLTSNVIENVQDLIHKVGPTPEVQEVIKTNVHLAVRAMGANPRLSKIFANIFHDPKQYISSHSTMLAPICCALASAQAWSSETTYYKLTMAAYLHDMLLTNQALAAISTREELEQRINEFNQNEYETYLTHPNSTAAMVRTFHEIPPDVDIIIAQHHERPDGSGFPRGLQHTHISPLSSVFILAHDLLDHIYNDPEHWNMNDFIVKSKKKYDVGNFKKLLKVLEKVKL